MAWYEYSTKLINDFKQSWPCHGLPDDLDLLRVEVDKRGEVQTIEAFAIHLDRTTKPHDWHEFDGPALKALVDDCIKMAVPGSPKPAFSSAGLLKLDSGEWFEICNEEDGYIASHLSQTAISHFYDQEEKRLHGKHEFRWFCLVGKNERDEWIGKVTLCVLPEGVENSTKILQTNCHTTGHHNKNAYPEFANEIEALAEVTGLSIPPNHVGRPINWQEEPQSPRM